LCIVSLGMGVFLICANRFVARMLTYGFPDDVA
jgi:hypothetical protein